MKTMKSFLENTHLPTKLVRAVVKQIGGWESFCESAPDICRGGIDGGFGGFTYYSETVKFFLANRQEIIDLAKQQADDFGTGVLEMIAGFNCLKGRYSIDEIGETLFGSARKCDDQIANALAWYAGEEVARAYCDWVDNE